jgi:hypothetical protein
MINSMQTLPFIHSAKIISMLKGRLRYFEPEIIIFTAITVLSILVFLCASIILHPDGSHFYYHFVSEHGAVTILSETLLATAGFNAYFAFLLTSAADGKQKLMFLILAVSLTYLAADEVLCFHEQIGDWLDGLKFLRKIFAVTPIRRWNDMIIIIYGLLAIPLMACFFQTMLKLPCLAEYFSMALIWFVIHTTIDSVVNEPTASTYIIEESAKVYTSTFISLGLMNALHFLMHQKFRGLHPD